EDMDRRQRIDVVECEHVLVVQDLLARQIPAQDFREGILVGVWLLGINRHKLSALGPGLTPMGGALPRNAMTDETPESLIPYDEIVQEALRDVVGRVLHEVEKSGGLPGGHHFYITFHTRMPGVVVPKHLSERFPDEMTI